MFCGFYGFISPSFFRYASPLGKNSIKVWDNFKSYAKAFVFLTPLLGVKQWTPWVIFKKKYLIMSTKHIINQIGNKNLVWTFMMEKQIYKDLAWSLKLCNICIYIYPIIPSQVFKNYNHLPQVRLPKEFMILFVDFSWKMGLSMMCPTSLFLSSLVLQLKMSPLI